MRRLAKKILLLAAFLHVQSTSGWTSSSPATCGVVPSRYASTSDRPCHNQRHLTAYAISFDSTISTYGNLASSIETPELPNLLVPFIAFVLLVASQTFINQMLSGDQGLGAFLRDGRGVGRSSFRPLTLEDKSRAVASDPLPWLKLPKLDYVQVAGQEVEQEISEKVDEGGEVNAMGIDSDDYPSR